MQKKHISNRNRNSINKIKITSTQIERKTILMRNENKKIGIHRQYEIQGICQNPQKKNYRIKEIKERQ